MGLGALDHAPTVGVEDGAESWQERARPPPKPSLSPEDFTYFSSTQDTFLPGKRKHVKGQHDPSCRGQVV